MTAYRTLAAGKIQIASSIKPRTYPTDELDPPDKNTMFDVCASLLVIDEGTNTVRLAHHTAREYLLENPIIPKDADLKIAIACTAIFHSTWPLGTP